MVSDLGLLVAPHGKRAALASKFCWPGGASRPLATTPRGWEGSALGWGGGFGVEPTALSDISREVPVLAWAMPERVGVAAAGARGSGSSRHDKPLSPPANNGCYVSISPTGLRRRQEPCAGLNITARCLWVGQQGKITGADAGAP